MANEISKNNSLKEYYLELKKISENALTILNGINNAFTAYTPDVVITLNDDTTVRIPSFLYLEDKIEEIETTISSLFSIPKSGEAWFSKSSNMYKLNMVNSDIAPVIPQITYDSNTNFAVKENNFFKDLVSPNTYIRLNVANLPENINEVIVKKIVLHNDSLITDIFNDDTLDTYNSYKEKLYLLNEGTDYSEYDFNLKMPVKYVKYNSKFDILDIVEEGTFNNDINSLVYKIRLNTLYYYDVNDDSIQYKLKVGDRLTLHDKYNIFKVLNINEYADYDNGDNVEYIVELQETNGHSILDTTENKNDVYFTLYIDPETITQKYIDIPLEENPYVILFVSSVYNNIRSNWSNAIKLNLNNIYINDGTSKLSYIDYYNKYCKNLGDIIYSIGKISYSQIDEYTNAQLKELTTGKTIKTLVTDTLGKENNEVLNVTVINSHLVDDEISSNLAALHKQKIELNNELSNINANIDSTYNQLVNTDFSLDTSVSQAYLKTQLDTYYNEKLKYQQQILSVINNIDLIKNDIVGYDQLKHRVRGVTSANDIDESGTESEIVAYLKENYGEKCQLIGLEVEYKYKNINQNSTTVENNSNTIFTDWVRVNNIEKQRYLKFDSITNNYTIEYVNYDTNSNIIKWNQIDIPISAGEDVVIRIRYKYSIGQPFINLYTPWSDEVTISYTQSDAANITDVSSILAANETDLLNSTFLKELINGGYQEHISNKIIDNSQVYYHMPENIYSGFNTEENKLISLKDKLIDMDKEITEYQTYINNELNSEYKVLLQYDDKVIELKKETLNTININNINTQYDNYVRKDMNLVIKNTGAMPINMYSIFPGNIEIPLIHTEKSFFNDNISNYERVPLLLENIQNPRESVFPQVQGQWIYFRQNNVFTGESLYNVNQAQNILDTINFNAKTSLTLSPDNILGFMLNDNSQLLIGYRERSEINNLPTWKSINITKNNYNKYEIAYNTYTAENNISFFDTDNISKFVYNNIILKYEHIPYTNSDNTISYLDQNISLSNLVNSQSKTIVQNAGIWNNENLIGAFLIPNLLNRNQILCDNNKNNQYKKINIGESITIPILLEYYLTDTNNKKITKTLAFDLKPSLTRQIDNYIMKIVVSTNIIDINSEEYIPTFNNEILNS